MFWGAKERVFRSLLEILIENFESKCSSSRPFTSFLLLFQRTCFALASMAKTEKDKVSFDLSGWKIGFRVSEIVGSEGRM